MKNLSPLCSVVLLETLKSSAVRFITSHPGLSYVFEQEVRPAPLKSFADDFARAVMSHCVGAPLGGQPPVRVTPRLWDVCSVRTVTVERYTLKRAPLSFIPSKSHRLVL